MEKCPKNTNLNDEPFSHGAIREIPEPFIPLIKPIRDIAIRIAIDSIIEKSKQSRQVRKRMAENLNLPWEDYKKVEAQALKIIQKTGEKQNGRNNRNHIKKD